MMMAPPKQGHNANHQTLSPKKQWQPNKCCPTYIVIATVKNEMKRDRSRTANVGLAFSIKPCACAQKNSYTHILLYKIYV
jgi:hypothetical protein